MHSFLQLVMLCTTIQTLLQLFDSPCYSVVPHVLLTRAFAAFEADSPVLERILGGFGT